MTVAEVTTSTASLSLKGLKVQPLKRNHSLDALFPSFKVQPHIGTEFKDGLKIQTRIQIRAILNAPNADELIRDFAVLVSERNVVFLRNQDITFEEQKEFVDRLGKAAGKPATSGLHTHPLTDDSSEFGEKSLVITSQNRDRTNRIYRGQSEFQSETWHTDITFENVPSDYALLRLRHVPPEGGDTIWASAYEVYERLSPAFQKFLEGLTATHAFSGTNPVTGWKGVFANKIFTKRINELSKDESDLNHDLQVRYRWNQHDVAVWDNRSTFHTATTDFDADKYLRLGERATSLGERPYFDAGSQSRREALGIAPPPARRAHLASLTSKTA
ncbi:taurine catabolism dioxygenase [Rhizoclosmatium globosum]|uniref:Taurine catabolism dioxygenase n=1 Tax=Rhizoclosmatium globosum TaxID=329046 RepID=A0A1Y2C2C0_9FUNG|nr:taurine catabolism dioxygenase [Rhizoclosmatium globosum]|eukprot:ORY41193.1 taurine catabolism dioxygenase [Rhizoclosmatium globosum]